MSGTDVEVERLRPVYDAWGRGDWTAGAELYGPEMVWAWTDEFPDVHGAYDDPDEANRMLRLWLAGWERWRCLAEDFVVAGDRVVVLVRYRGRGHVSGLELEAPAAHVWTMRGPKAARLDVYMDRDRALREAGVAG